MAGNTDDAFAIDPATGVLTVNNSAALDLETRQRFDLTVRVADNGNPAQAGFGVVTVFLRDQNDAPVVTPTQFLIGENSVNNAFIGVVPASDQDAGQTRTYSLVAGNTDDAFAIDPTTGVLTVNNSTALDFETQQRFDLTVRVVDDGNPAQAGFGVVTVFLRDENEPPLVAPTEFLIGEDSVDNAFIGIVPSSDPDTSQIRTYSIVGGNTDEAFAIHPTTGVLTVNNSIALDFETRPRFDLTVRVIDDGNPAQTGFGTVTVFLRIVAGARPAASVAPLLFEERA